MCQAIGGLGFKLFITTSLVIWSVSFIAHSAKISLVVIVQSIASRLTHWLVDAVANAEKSKESFFLS